MQAWEVTEYMERRYVFRKQKKGKKGMHEFICLPLTLSALPRFPPVLPSL